MAADSIPANEAERLRALHQWETVRKEQDETLESVCRLVGRLLDLPIALVSVAEEARQVFLAEVGIDPQHRAQDWSFCAYTLHESGITVVEDAAIDPRFCNHPIVTGIPGVRFYLGASLTTRDGETLGVLCAIGNAPRQVSQREREVIGELARLVVSVLEARREMRLARTMALTDPLTGLANRAGLTLELSRAIAIAQRYDIPFTLVLFDCDNFKPINDRFGHAAGDAALERVARVLADCIRQEDLAARLGGDEFAVMMFGCDAATAEAAATRLVAELDRAMATDDLPLTFSLGVASFATPPEGVEAALAFADGLMYAAKNAGKNRRVAGSYAPRVLR